MLLENLQVTASELPDIEQAEFHFHPKRYRTFRLINLALLFAVLSLGWVIALLNDITLSVQIGLMVMWLAGLILFLVEEVKGFWVRGFALRAYDISYRKGFFRFSLTTIPFNRIQHSEISQGPLARLFKLSSLKIYTAGGSSSDLKIAGLEPDEAKKLRDYIAKATASYE